MNDERVRQLLDAGQLDDAVTEIVRTAGPEILRFLLATARDEAAASDAFGRWSERVWRALPTFRWDCTLRSWLYIVARTALLDEVTHRQRRGKREAPLDSQLIQQAAAVVRTATLSLYQAENVDAITRLRASLPEEDRMLLVLRVDRELEWSDIADAFLRDELADRPDDATLTREAARLRKRFQLVKQRLYELATEQGLIRKRDD